MTRTGRPPRSSSIRRVRRRGLDGRDGRPYGLELEVDAPAVPDLRWEVADDRRLLLRQGGAVVLLGRMGKGHSGVALCRTSRYRSAVPPPSAAWSRRTPEPRTPAWYMAWAHRFAGLLADSASGPLHVGRWLLRSVALPPYTFRSDLVTSFPGAYLDWSGQAWNGVVPLRPLPEADTARVKAYRKQARDSVMPPVLLWAASCLDGYLLLDGHARLAAALAEGLDPPSLTLTPGLDAGTRQSWLDGAAVHHTKVLEGITRRGGPDHHSYQAAEESFARQYARLYTSLQQEPARTRAWLLPGGTAAWDRAAADAPDGRSLIEADT